MAEVKSVAVLGTGIMGAPMARNLAASGLETSAWNRTREKAEKLTGDGVVVRDTPAAAARDADAVITMLATSDAVREVMGGDGGALEAMGAEAIWLQMSTVGIAATRELAELAREAGVTFLDAPVLGTKEPAEQGNLVTLAAGPADAIDRCRPVFDAIGAKTIALEEPGEATRLKLVLNNWVLSVTVATAETIALAEHLGVDPRRFFEAVEGGPLDSGYARVKGRMMLEGSFDPSFPLRLALKDVDLVLEAASQGGDGPALPRAVRERFAAAAAMGHGDEDMAAVYLAIRQEAGERS